MNLLVSVLLAISSFESTHFQMQTSFSKDEVLPIYALPALEIAYQRIGKDLGLATQRKVPVVVYPTWKDFIAASTLTEKEVRTTGTIALFKFGKIMLTTPRAMLTGYDWIDTVTHEFTHYVINEVSRGQAPLWLHEGLAKYMESRWRRENGGELSNRSMSLFSRRKNAKELVPFSKFYPSFAKLPSAEDAETAYAQVFLVVRYLDQERGGFSNLKALLQKFGQGVDENSAFTAVYGETFSSLYQKWLKWIDLQKFPQEHLEFRKKEFAKGEKTSDESESFQIQELESQIVRDHVRLGTLLESKKRWKAASEEYRTAIAKYSKTSAYLEGKVGISEFEANDPMEAEKWLSKSIDHEPEGITPYLYRGNLYLRNRRLESAEKDLLSANAINPFDPRIHEALAEVYKLEKQDLKREQEEKVLGLLNGK